MSERDTCTACGAVLSQYGEPGATLCAPCSRASSRPPLQLLDRERLIGAVAGVLFMARALRPGESVYLQRELAELGVYADHIDLQHAIQKLRRRGCAIEATPRVPGYRLTGWSLSWAWHRRRS